MGADGTARLYDQMNTLMQTGIAGSTSDQPSDQNQQKEAQ